MALKSFRVVREVTITQVATVEVDLPNYLRDGVLNGAVQQYVLDDENAHTWEDLHKEFNIIEVKNSLDVKQDSLDNVYLIVDGREHKFGDFSD